MGYSVTGLGLVYDESDLKYFCTNQGGIWDHGIGACICGEGGYYDPAVKGCVGTFYPDEPASDRRLDCVDAGGNWDANSNWCYCPEGMTYFMSATGDLCLPTEQLKKFDYDKADYDYRFQEPSAIIPTPVIAAGAAVALLALYALLA